MKYPEHFLTTCLCIFLATTLPAQHGSVAAGGNAAGYGGSMSFSIGQTDFLYYNSEHGSMSHGLQQTWFANPDIPVTLEIENTIIPGGEALCYNALETVIVAGDGNYFIVEAYGHADIIAGNNILLKPGTKVEFYGSLHASISNTGCPPQESLLASSSEPILPKPLVEPETYGTFFKVYPNPTTGNFTLELIEFEEFSNIRVELYSALGHLVFDKQLPALKTNNLSISDKQPSIYLVRVIKDHKTGAGKIIRQ